DLTITTSTFYGNYARGFGGGIASSATLVLTDSTISGNTAQFGGGGGFYNLGADGSGYGNFTVGSTIIAANSALHDPDFLESNSAQLQDHGYNLIGVGDGLSFQGGSNHDLVGTSGSPLDPRLAALGDHGGPTLTLALLA